MFSSDSFLFFVRFIRIFYFTTTTISLWLRLAVSSFGCGARMPADRTDFSEEGRRQGDHIALMDSNAYNKLFGKVFIKT